MADDYPTCEETYVTLRIYHDSADPASVTAALALDPTDSQRVGESYERRGVTRTYPLSGWFLCSEGHVESYDTAKHLDWLLQQLPGARHAPLSRLAYGHRLPLGFSLRPRWPDFVARPFAASGRCRHRVVVRHLLPWRIPRHSALQAHQCDSTERLTLRCSERLRRRR